MGEVFIWRLFNQVAIKPNVWGEQTDNAIVAKTLSEEIPQSPSTSRLSFLPRASSSAKSPSPTSASRVSFATRPLRGSNQTRRDGPGRLLWLNALSIYQASRS